MSRRGIATASGLVAAARSSVECADAEAVAAELDAGGAVLLDVREAAELTEQGRIAGALWVPRGRLEFRADPTHPGHQPGLEPDRRIIVYSAAGERSALAAATLRAMGYERVSHLEGGLAAWKQAGRPTV